MKSAGEHMKNCDASTKQYMKECGFDDPNMRHFETIAEVREAIKNGTITWIEGNYAMYLGMDLIYDYNEAGKYVLTDVKYRDEDDPLLKFTDPDFYNDHHGLS